MRAHHSIGWLAALASVTVVCAQASAAVGRTPGVASVSAAGTANYTIPLTVPPGRNGLTPTLALRYDHTLGNGLVGVGWSIDGLSAIMRCNRTLAQDLGPSVPVLSPTDAYCLDGQRLRLTSADGTYGQDASTYQTEIDVFSRVTAVGSAGTPAAGPTSWTVYRKDGLIYKYGGTTDSNILSSGTTAVRLWALSSIEDRDGNKITYTYPYPQENGSYRPVSISYTAHASAGAANRINFVYKSGDRSDPIYSFRYARTASPTEGQMNQLKLLDHIDVVDIASSAVVRSFMLTYETGGQSGDRQRLKTVQECREGDCLSPTTFTSINGTPGWDTETNVSSATPTTAFAGDINGDGREDIVYYGTSQWQYILGGDPSFTVYNTGFSSTKAAEAQAIEYDGDGLMDILVPCNSSTNWCVLKSSTSGFTLLDTQTSALGSNGQVLAIDIDGDGRDDLVRQIRTTQPQLAVRLHVNGPSGYLPETIAWTGETYLSFISDFDTKQNSNIRRRTDFNGDGREDFVVRMYEDGSEPETPGVSFRYLTTFYGFGNIVTESNIQICASSGPTLCNGTGTYGDFNGDGLTDLLIRGNGTLYYASVGRGDVVSQALAGPDVSQVSAGAILAVDYNGDGMDDLLMPKTVSGVTTWQVARSTGNGFTTLQDLGIVTTGGSAGIVIAADTNGDGLADILRTDAGGLKLRLHSGVQPDLLDTATDGYGIQTDFNYDRLASPTGCYAREGAEPTSPKRRRVEPGYVVCSLVSSNGNGTNHTQTFSYRNANVDNWGRGYLGFERRITTDSRDNISHDETYSQDFPTTGMLKSYVSRQPNNGPIIRELTNTLDAVAYTFSDATGFQNRRAPYVRVSVAKDYEAKGTYDGVRLRTVTTTNTISATSATITRSHVKVDEGSSANGRSLNAGQSYEFDTYFSDVLENTAQWCLGRPKRTEQTNNHSLLPSGTAVTRITDTEWDAPKCRPTKVTVEPGDADYEVATSFHYDGFGNIDTITQTPAVNRGQNDRVTTISWGSDGRFPRTITNPELHSTQLQWDIDSGTCTAGTSKFGTLRCVTDPNNLTTRFDTDVFARLTLEARPDLTSTEYVLGACNSGNSYCGLGQSDLRTSVEIRERGGTGNVLFRTDTQYFDGLDRVRFDDSQALTGGSSRITTTYNDRGLVASRSRPFTSAETPKFTTVEYDLLGRPTHFRSPTSESDPSEHDTEFSYEGLTTVAYDALDRSTAQIRNAIGAVVLMRDAGNNYTNYEYDAFGNLLKVLNAANRSVDMTYTKRGLKLTLNDPAMTQQMVYGYYPFGELKSQKDAKNVTITFEYDKLSRLKKRTEPEGDTLWTWDTVKKGMPTTVAAPGYSETYSYDASARPSQTRITIGADNYFYDFGYDTITGLIETLTYPASTGGTRLKVKYGYQAGIMQSVTDYTGDVNGTVYWQGVTANSAGQFIDELYGNTLRTISSYDRITALLTSRTTGPSGGTSIQNLAYDWNKVGSLTWRKDWNQNLTETFQYDALDRIDYSTLGSTANLDIGPDVMGNIVSKADNAAPPTQGTAIQWYSYNLPYQITRGSNTSQLYYTPDRERLKQVVSGTDSETVTYIGGLLEKREFGSPTTTEYRHYIYGGDGPVALVHRRSTGVNATYYFSTDHLGSLDVVTNSSGVAVLRMSFDAYGNRRGTNWTGAPSAADQNAMRDITRRGFTFHEHLDGVGLIHMNGRVYDPTVGSFTSADPFVQAPFFSQSLNRYSYTFNNPLTYTDPSGFDADDNNWHPVIPVPACFYLDCRRRSIYTPSLPVSPYRDPGLTAKNQADPNTRAESTVDRFVQGAQGAYRTVDAGIRDYVGRSIDGFRNESVGEFTQSVLSAPLPVIGVESAAANSLVALRATYLKNVDDLVGMGLSIRAAGLSGEQAARILVTLRNALKLELRAQGPWLAARLADIRNLIRYGNRAGPTADQLYERYGTWDRVLESVGRTNATIDEMLGVGR